MAWKRVIGTHLDGTEQYIGTTIGDLETTNIPNGSTAMETDEGIEYRFNGTSWVAWRTMPQGDATYGLDVDVTRLPAQSAAQVISPTGGSKTVTASGTAEALVAVSTKKSMLYVRAKTTNTGNVYLGDSAVDKTTSTQIILTAGQAVTFGMDTGYVLDANQFYIDADVNAEGVDFLYL